MKLISTFLLFLSCALSALAQTNNNPVLAVMVQTDRVDKSSRLISELNDTTAMYGAKMKIFLKDTVGITQIQVTVKRDKDSAALLEENFAYDVTLSSGDFTYSRNKRTIELGLGNLPGIQHLYAEVKVVRNGVLSDPVTYRR